MYLLETHQPFFFSFLFVCGVVIQLFWDFPCSKVTEVCESVATLSKKGLISVMRCCCIDCEGDCLFCFLS